MTQIIINTGVADKGNGDPIRTAFTKVNANFTELYTLVGAASLTELAQDYAAEMFTDGTHVGVAVEYDDASNVINLTALGQTSSGATAPVNPTAGTLWWDSVSGRLYVYYGSTWVDASPVDGAGISSTNELVNGGNTVSLGSDGSLTFPSGTLADLGGAEFGTGFSLTTDGDQAIIGASNLISLETSGGLGQLHLTQDTETDKGRVEIFFQNGPGVLWIFDEEDSSLTFPDTTKQTTAWTGSVSSLVNSTKTVSLGSNGTLTLPSQPNLLTNVNQIFTTKIYKAAKTPTPTPAEITAAYDYWLGEQEFYNTLRNEDASSIAPATRSWAGLPPWEAYPLIVGFTGPGLPPMPNLAPAAQSATNAYLSWKELVSNLEIVNGNQTISFENTGNLILPSTVSMNGKLSLGPTLGGIHANQDTGIISIGDYIDADTGYGLAPSTTIAIGGAANVFQISTYGPPAKTWTFARNGNLTLPSGNSVISNLNVVGDLSTGSQIQVGSGAAADTGIIISNGTTNDIDGSVLQAESVVNVNGTTASMAFKTFNSLGAGGPTLTGEEMVEVSSSGVRIGVRVTNDPGDGSPPLISFRGWTFDNDELSLPIGTVISETPAEHGLNRTKYSGTFVLDPTWFAANAGNIVNGDSFPEGILQNYDEVSGAFSFQYFGYFVPPTSANYTFRAHADETFVFWIGSKALSGYTYANKDMYGNYNGTFPEQQTQSFTIALTAGEFYPIRIQWANSGGIGQLDVFTWANDAGQANTADFTGRVFRENTGTAKIAVNDNRSIILSTDNATDNNWTFAPNGSLTFPDATTTTGKSITVPVDQSLTVNTSYSMGPGGATTFKISPEHIKLPTGNGVIFSGTETAANSWGLDSANKTLYFPDAGDGVNPQIYYSKVDGVTGMELMTYAKSIKITAAQTSSWTFGADGELALPTNGYTEAVIKELDATALVLFAQKAGANVKILAGATSAGSAKQWLFNGTNGNLTLPASGDVVDSTSVSQLAKRVEGSWTVTTGTNTYSFTVPADGTYTMWVKGNIPNGIITWNATLSISNTNVPAIGTQYAWNYTGGGSPILLTAIPDQIRGVAGTISTDATYAGITSNRFDFGISNTSGSSQTIYYGYTKV